MVGQLDVFAICGYLGSGKTKLAIQLSRRGKAVRLSLDELYLREVGIVSGTSRLEPDVWALIENRAYSECEGLLRSGSSVVMDFGFWTFSERERARRLAFRCGARWRLYYARALEDVALQRCLARNALVQAGHPAFLVTSDMFRLLRSKFCPPSRSERATEVWP